MEIKHQCTVSKIRRKMHGQTVRKKRKTWQIKGKTLFCMKRQIDNNKKIIKVMPSKQEPIKKYAHISHELRLELIDLVQKENYPLSVASDLLGVKLSTAKLIMSKYKSKGYVTKYKNEKNSEELSHSLSSSKKEVKNDSNPSHQHQTQYRPDPQRQNISIQPLNQANLNGTGNLGETTIQGASFGVIPWNGLMLPFLYVWNPPQ